MTSPRLQPRTLRTPLALAMALAAAGLLAACSTTPPQNAALDTARSDLRAVQAQPQAQTYAGAELKQANDALALAEAAFARKDDIAAVDQLAYLAKQRAALAQEAIRRKTGEASIAQAGAARDQMRLAARTQEADAATRSAGVAQRDAQAAQAQSQAAQRQAQGAQMQAMTAQQQAADAERRNQALQLQLQELNARKTDRGMVVTIGDVLFDTGRSQLRAGGVRNLDKLGAFLKSNPQRRAMIEGYTDSVGGDMANQELSSRRADAVRSALVQMGVPMDRLATEGFGETHPVADNATASGRQMNRRVEVVLSDERGEMSAR
jgi:outer membrane protein OmpA-like peptidoglycan-associated protein